MCSDGWTESTLMTDLCINFSQLCVCCGNQLSLSNCLTHCRSENSHSNIDWDMSLYDILKSYVGEFVFILFFSVLGKKNKYFNTLIIETHVRAWLCFAWLIELWRFELSYDFETTPKQGKKEGNSIFRPLAFPFSFCCFEEKLEIA